MLGKDIRIASFFRNNRTFLLALDTLIPHGFDENLSTFKDVEMLLAKNDFDGIVIHSGLLKNLPHKIQINNPWIAKLTTNSKRHDQNRVFVDSIKKAINMGASGVAINVFVGSEHENKQFKWLKETSSKCHEYGMPLIVFASPYPDTFEVEEITYTTRVVAELGADIVKTNYPGSEEKFKKVVKCCPVPVVVERSPHSKDKEGTIKTVKESIKAGGAGVLFGGRIWSHSYTEEISEEINNIIKNFDV